MFKKEKLDCFYGVYRFPHHKDIKSTILDLIDKQPLETLTIKDTYYGDNISKLDWNSSTDPNRLWVKYFFPLFKKSIDAISIECGYQSATINQLWFQQYYNNDVHGWHIHGSNLTGVYYVELPETAPKTQLVNPFSQNEIITPDIKEGDFLIFPSMAIHRAPVIKSNIRKTIISWNWDFELIEPNTLSKIDHAAKDQYESI